MKTEYPPHPASALFPLMADAELKELADDIKAHGLVQPIILLHDQVLDGRNRQAACALAGVEPRFEYYANERSPVEYVLAANLKRRQLTPTQKATVAAEALPMLEAEAKERQATSTGGKHPQLKTKLSEAEKGQARDKAAKLTGASPSYVSDAKRIQKKSPKIFEKMKAGKVTMAEAKKETEEPAKPKKERINYQPSNGMQYAQMAVGQLKKIHPKDTQRDDGFDHVIAWINKNR